MANKRTHISDPFRVVLQKFLKGAELLDDALDCVELVSPDNDLLALIEGTQRLKFRLDAGTLSNRKR